jgi:hypothetical protein
MTPARQPSAWDGTWERMLRAVELVRDRLTRTTAALEAADVPYAVVGGHAVAFWVASIDEGATRNTPDVNVLVRRADADGARAALVEAGFVPHEIPGGLLFLDGPKATERQAVHVFFAREKVRDEDVLPTPDVSESVAGRRFRVIDLEALLRMKLTAFRTKDRMHVRDLLDVGAIDASWTSRLVPELAVRLQQILDNPNG